MENIVALAVELESGQERFFLTWGRIQDPVDRKPLETLILEQANRFAIGGNPVSARLCSSLQEASKEGGFYEMFFEMSQKKIPFGVDTYEPWRQKIDELMRQGKELYYCWHYDNKDKISE